MLRPELIELIEFIKGKFGSDIDLPLHEPRFNDEEKLKLVSCVESTYVSSVGKYVDEVELKIAEYTGAKYAIATINGTSALHLALLIAGVEADTEVLTQPLSFVATSNAIKYCGASSVFIDIDCKNLGMSASALQEFLESSAENRGGVCVNRISKRKISACVPMHTFGHPCEIDKLKMICDEWAIPLVEDAAESLGSFYKNKHTGTYGLLGTISFNGNKIITAGGGGAILTDDTAVARKAKHISSTAKLAHQWDFIHDQIGFNYRMPNLNAALLSAQLEKLNDFVLRKRRLAKDYKNWCTSMGVNFFSEPNNARSNYWLNTILLDDEVEKLKFLEFANSCGVQCRPAWKLLNELPMFRSCTVAPLDNAKNAVKRIVNLPSSVI